MLHKSYKSVFLYWNFVFKLKKLKFETKKQLCFIDGEIHRGCTGDVNVPVLESCHNDMNCQTCIGVNNRGGCNNEVYIAKYKKIIFFSFIFIKCTIVHNLINI